jgi:hypothetical protein
VEVVGQELLRLEAVRGLPPPDAPYELQPESISTAAADMVELAIDADAILTPLYFISDSPYNICRTA